METGFLDLEMPVSQTARIDLPRYIRRSTVLW